MQETYISCRMFCTDVAAHQYAQEGDCEVHVDVGTASHTVDTSIAFHRYELADGIQAL